jgi:hypothetical protein
MNDTVSKAIWLTLGLLIAGIFIKAAVPVLGIGQDTIITEVKKVENY